MLMEKILNLDKFEDRWADGNWSKEDLIAFEDEINQKLFQQQI